MDVAEPYKFIGCGAMDVTKLYLSTSNIGRIRGQICVFESWPKTDKMIKDNLRSPNPNLGLEPPPSLGSWGGVVLVVCGWVLRVLGGLPIRGGR